MAPGNANTSEALSSAPLLALFAQGLPVPMQMAKWSR